MITNQNQKTRPEQIRDAALQVAEDLHAEDGIVKKQKAGLIQKINAFQLARKEMQLAKIDYEKLIEQFIDDRYKRSEEQWKKEIDKIV